jgi:hypothetical protein
MAAVSAIFAAAFETIGHVGGLSLQAGGNL